MLSGLTIIDYEKTNKAAQFDGISVYGDTTTANLPTTAGSLSAMVRIDNNLVTANTYAFITGSSGNIWLTCGKAGTSDRMVVRGTFSGTNANAFYTVNYVVGQWVHLLATFDGTNFKAYHNGVLYSTQNRSGQTLSIVGSYLWFARSSIYTPVTIDEVSIWNRAVSVSEVYDSINSIPIILNGNESGLLRYYKMGDVYTPGSYSIRNEVSGNAHPIQLFNFTQTDDFVDGINLNV